MYALCSPNIGFIPEYKRNAYMHEEETIGLVYTLGHWFVKNPPSRESTDYGLIDRKYLNVYGHSGCKPVPQAVYKQCIIYAVLYKN